MHIKLKKMNMYFFIIILVAILFLIFLIPKKIENFDTSSSPKPPIRILTSEMIKKLDSLKGTKDERSIS